MAKILVSDSLSEEGRKILEGGGENELVYLPEITPEDLVDEIAKGYEALVIRSRTQVTGDVLRAGKDLKIVGRAGVGVDNVDIPVATECGIMVANAPDGNTVFPIALVIDELAYTEHRSQTLIDELVRLFVEICVRELVEVCL